VNKAHIERFTTEASDGEKKIDVKCERSNEKKKEKASEVERSLFCIKEVT